MTIRRRAFHVVSDVLHLVVVVAGVVTVAATLTGTWWPGVGQWIVGFFVLILTVFALPSLIVLWLAPPLRPLAQRSALVAGAAWFWRTAIAFTVFVFTLVAGSVAGVIAAAAADAGDERSAIARAWETLGAIAVPPALVLVALSFIVMGARWIYDLGRLIDDGTMKRIVHRVENRWFGEPTTTRAASLARSAVEISIDLGRIPLGLLVVTVLVLSAIAVVTSTS